jgi:hypothetical protein
MIQKVLKPFLFLLFPFLAFGWGQTGHRVIGEVAQAHLNRKAQKAVNKLLEGSSLAAVSTYMDEIKSDDKYDYTHDWHWVTIPSGETYPETEKNPDGDAVEAINRMKKVLADETKTQAERAKALKFLVHLVGDLHQPLHVGNGLDRGGNNVKVKWFGKSSNLHRVWDSEMLRSRDFAYSELSEELLGTLNKKTKEEWSRGATEDWAHEAMQYREQVYNTGNTERMGYRYTYKNWDLLTQQLAKGGVRLAAILNQILG